MGEATYGVTGYQFKYLCNLRAPRAPHVNKAVSAAYHYQGTLNSVYGLNNYSSQNAPIIYSGQADT